MITGAHGLLGQKTALVLAQETEHQLLLTDLAGDTFFANERFDYQQLDIASMADVKSLVAQYRPDVIVNAAAMTDVDACEVERERAWRINVDGLKHLLIAARKLGSCFVVQVSTDYVFDGREGDYTEAMRPNPLGYYGKSKLAAENALLSSGVGGAILRTQVLYGTGYNVRKNFVTWVLDQAERKQRITAVTDQVGNPTLADDLAFAILKVAARRRAGLYHVSGPEPIDRHAFAQRILEVFRMPTELAPVLTADLNQAAPRPMNSSFITLKFEAEFGYRLSGVMQGLRRMLQQVRDGMEHTDLLKPKP
jgi:dTDP-4-dehydrorhamnose reductase